MLHTAVIKADDFGFPSQTHVWETVIAAATKHGVTLSIGVVVSKMDKQHLKTAHNAVGAGHGVFCHGRYHKPYEEQETGVVSSAEMSSLGLPTMSYGPPHNARDKMLTGRLIDAAGYTVWPFGDVLPNGVCPTHLLSFGSTLVRELNLLEKIPGYTPSPKHLAVRLQQVRMEAPQLTTVVIQAHPGRWRDPDTIMASLSVLLAEEGIKTETMDHCAACIDAPWSVDVRIKRRRPGDT